MRAGWSLECQSTGREGQGGFVSAGGVGTRYVLWKVCSGDVGNEVMWRRRGWRGHRAQQRTTTAGVQGGN